MMKCPVRDGAEPVRGTRDGASYKGESTIIPPATGDFRPACGEPAFEKGESGSIGFLMLEFNRQINACTVDPKLIANARKKLLWTGAKPAGFSKAVSMRFHAVRTAGPGRRRRSQDACPCPVPWLSRILHS
jgi:hypothetical protein